MKPISKFTKIGRLNSLLRYNLLPTYFNILSLRGKKSDEVSCLKSVYENVSLSSDERKEIKNLWGQIIPGNLSRGYIFYRMAKACCGFDCRFLPSSYFYPYIYRALNDLNQGIQLSHKSLAPIYFQGFNQPLNVVCSIGGKLYNNDYKSISGEEACSLINNENQSLIVKPAIYSEQGNGVKFIAKGSKSFEELCKDLVSGRLLKSFSDIVIQPVVEQSATTKIFNPTSLNCFRLTTININGDISIGSSALKCGGINCHVDNIGGGRGGVIIGVSEDGILNDKGYLLDGTQVESHNGKKFQNYKITNYQKVKEFAIDLAKTIPNMGIVGWDIALDSNDEPILIEGNTEAWPGITLEQFCSGPIFGQRTKEVIDFVKNNQK